MSRANGVAAEPARMIQVAGLAAAAAAVVTARVSPRRLGDGQTGGPLTHRDRETDRPKKLASAASDS